MSRRDITQSFSVSYSFAVRFTRCAFDPSNLVLRDTLRLAGERRHRVLVALDSNLADADPGLLQRFAEYAAAPAATRADAARGLPRRSAEYAAPPAAPLARVAPPYLVRGGEICKSDPVEVSAIHALVEKHGIDRQSFVLAIGGGAVLDAVGYA